MDGTPRRAGRSSPEEERIPFTYEFRVPAGQGAERLDVWLARMLPHASRTKVQRAIESGHVSVNGRTSKPSYRIRPGDLITCTVYRLPPMELLPEPIPLDIVYEDAYLMVINKPAGLPTHPGIGHRRGTVVNAVLHHLGLRQPIRIETELGDEEEDEGALFSSEAVRPGIVHRLDKDTSGLLLIVKDAALHAVLSEQFAQRRIHREYLALVWGRMPEKADSSQRVILERRGHGIIDAPIGRSPRNRKAFAVVPSGKPARTEYWVLEEYPIVSFLRLRLHTGRTHQIRVHLSWVGHPVVGDPLYGGDAIRVTPPEPRWRRCAERCLSFLSRQALHAYRLSFLHPVTRQWIECEAPLPPDMEAAIAELRMTAQETELQSPGAGRQCVQPDGEFLPAARCR